MGLGFNMISQAISHDWQLFVGTHSWDARVADTATTRPPVQVSSTYKNVSAALAAADGRSISSEHTKTNS